MPDKKRKKLKQKQKQTQKQTQQVIVNIGSSRRQQQSRRESGRPPQQPQQLIQPPPVVQYVYRDNLALNMLNDKTRTAAATQQQQQASNNNTTTTTTTTTPPPPPPPAVVATPRNTNILPQPNFPPPSSVARVLENNKIHKTSSVPVAQDTKRSIAADFEKILNPKKANKPDEETVGFRNVNSPLDNVATSQSNVPTAFRLTIKGLPYRRTREEKIEYNNYMEKVIANKPASERTREEARAYNAYLNTLSKPQANDDDYVVPAALEEEPSSSLIRPTLRKPRKIQPVDFDTVDEREDNNEQEEDEEMFFSPLKKKPT
jgi:hypothetical protein